MKLNRLKSIVNQILRESSASEQGYMIDPFYHYTPEFEIIIDLKTGSFNPELKGDDVERYYKSLIDWFHKVLVKEKIPNEIIEKAILTVSPSGKECIVEARGRRFYSTLKFK